MFGFFDQALQFIEVIAGNAMNIASGFMRALGLLGIIAQIPTVCAGFLPGLLGASCLVVSAILVCRFFLMK